MTVDKIAKEIRISTEEAEIKAAVKLVKEHEVLDDWTISIVTKIPVHRVKTWLSVDQ